MSKPNRQLALEAVSVISEGRTELIDALIHPDYHSHERSADRPGGPEGFKETVATSATRSPMSASSRTT